MNENVDTRDPGPRAWAPDHLVVGCLDLDEGARWLEARLGVAPDAGGAHEGFGTRNRLLSLGEDLYLELLAPDPAQPRPPRPRLFGLDAPATRERLARGPALLHWVARAATPAALDALVAGPLGESVGRVVTMRRGELAWRIALRDDGARPPGGLPTAIDWGAAAHPCARLPDRGWRLARAEVAGATQAAARWLRSNLADARIVLAPTDLDRRSMPADAAGGPALRAWLRAADGREALLD